MPDKNPEAAPLGLPGRTLTVISRTEARTDKTPSAKVSHELLADKFLNPVAALGGGKRIVINDGVAPGLSWTAAEHGNRARKDDGRSAVRSTACLE